MVQVTVVSSVCANVLCKRDKWCTNAMKLVLRGQPPSVPVVPAIPINVQYAWRGSPNGAVVPFDLGLTPHVSQGSGSFQTSVLLRIHADRFTQNLCRGLKMSPVYWTLILICLCQLGVVIPHFAVQFSIPFLFVARKVMGWLHWKGKIATKI